MARVLLLGGYAPSLLNFRAPLLAALRARGHEVWAAAAEDDAQVSATLERMGVGYRALPLARAGLDPLRDLRSLRAIESWIRELRPHVFLGYTAKAVIYGSIAARRAGVERRFALITGLGWSFIGGSLAARLVGRIVRGLYRHALRGAALVFFQNGDDLALFRESRLLAAGAATRVVGGSGVDLERFAFTPLPSGPPVVLLVARLLRDKGILEYAEAARRVKARRPDARFRLVGPSDPNPAGIGARELEAIRGEGAVEVLGEAADVRPHLRACSLYCLPSYREGMPRTVLEAMATGRAILTTDVPGCRDTVREGENGRLVPARDAAALAAALEEMLADPGSLDAMGRRSRAIAEQRFDARKVAAEMVEAMGL